MTRILVGASFCAVLLLLTTLSNHAIAQDKSLYDKVLKNGKIRCAYVVYNPGFLKDPNTKKMSGIGHDVIELAAKNLGLKVEWVEEVTWATMIEGLKTKRYDMIATPIWANATRARLVDFSRPLFYSPLCTFVKSGNTKFNNNLNAINDGKIRIATMDGEMTEMIARNDYPKAKRVAVPQMADITQLALNVSTGKADVTFMEPAIAHGFLQKNPKSIVNINPNTPNRVFPNSFLIDKNELGFKNMLDIALDEISNSGQIDAIIHKYEPFPNALKRVSNPYK